MKLKKIISGGQTGADQAGLAVAGNRDSKNPEVSWFTKQTIYDAIHPLISTETQP